MEKFLLEQKSTGKKYNVTANDLKEAKIKLAKFITESKKKEEKPLQITEKQLQEYVRKAVVASLNENDVDEGLWGGLKGMFGAAGNAAGNAAKQAGSAVASAAKGAYNKAQQAYQQGSEKQDINNFNKGVGKAQTKIANVIANKIDPILQQYGINPSFRQSFLTQVTNLLNQQLKSMPQQGGGQPAAPAAEGGAAAA